MNMGPNNNEVQNENFLQIENAIRNQIRFWERFFLSLPGRIAISKSMLYSQINYLGCFMPLTSNQIDKLSSLITTFVQGNLNIAKGRLFQQPSMGGARALQPA